jgi:hypothetical protein
MIHVLNFHPRMARPQATHGVSHGHESKDIRIRWVIFAVIGLLVSAVLIHLVIWRYQIWATRGRIQTAAPSTLTPGLKATERWADVPSPRLQISPKEEMAAFLVREREEMDSYGWINPTAGTVRIPIERAMDLIAERGLPVRQNQTAGKTPLEMMQERKNRAAETPEGSR